MEKKSKFTLLDTLSSPHDLRKLKVDQLEQLCAELREDIIEELACNPGHFAASLGVVELTVALHYIFNTPYDRLVWDVGHQAYAHKILTERKDIFCTNRKLGGIKPFPSPEESEYDTFVCGHASNSISAALGMSVASRMQGETDRQVVAIIGDGSMSGGLAFEGLNNASSIPNDLLIILNDNDMSIDKSVGGMKQYLVNLTTSQPYNQLRYQAAKVLRKMNLLTEDRKNALIRLGNSLKSVAVQEHNIFEGLNIRYFGPVDGHDIKGLTKVLRDIKNMKGPKLLHLHTVKGKGFKPAERQATIWHAPGKFDPKTGKRITVDTKNQPLKYQDVFGQTLLELAKQNKKIIGVTPAMPTGCSMNIMMEEMPNRAFDVGIAEGHAVTFSGGMAKDGLQPFCNIYSTFMQRAYDNVIHDVAILNLPVVLCLDRGGLVGEDGPTHHGVFDLAYFRSIPNLTICSPMDEPELRRLMYTAQLPNKGAFVIRYPRGRGVTKDWKCEFEEITVGKGRTIIAGEDLAVITLGPLGHTAKAAIERINAEGHHVALYDLRFLKPLDEEMLHDIGKKFDKIITIEDGVIMGGMGSAILEFMSDHNYYPAIKRLGVPDQFVEHGPVEKLHEICGYDEASIEQTIREQLAQQTKKFR